MSVNEQSVSDEMFIREIKRLPKDHYARINRDGIKFVQWWNPEVFMPDPVAESGRNLALVVKWLLISSVGF